MKNIKKLYALVFGKMPLMHNFIDYNEYWKIRKFSATAAFRRAEIISSYICKNKKIIDIGCGDGTLLKFINTHNNPKYLLGIDISEDVIDYVKKQGFNAKTIDVLSSDFENLMKTTNFDYIIITEVLEHIQDPEFVVETIKRYQDANIFISIPNAGFFPHRIRLLFGKFPLVVIQTHIKEHIRFWTLKDFKYWVGYHGFKIDKLSPSAGFGVRKKTGLGNLFPSLFANQIIYQISKY
jgi:methionine biosynthesis protein MetW